jgi:hypothetical protein
MEMSSNYQQCVRFSGKNMITFIQKLFIRDFRLLLDQFIVVNFLFALLLIKTSFTTTVSLLVRKNSNLLFACYVCMF